MALPCVAAFVVALPCVGGLAVALPCVVGLVAALPSGPVVLVGLACGYLILPPLPLVALAGSLVVVLLPLFLPPLPLVAVGSLTLGPGIASLATTTKVDSRKGPIYLSTGTLVLF